MKKIINKIKRYFNLPIWWHYCNIYKKKNIGKGTKIGSYCEIGKKVMIGENCHIEAFTFIPDGVLIESAVFVGPGTIFLNDKYPPSYGRHWKQTIIGTGARIGGGCVILPGADIGANAIIGSGSVVTKPVPEGELWYGESSKFRGKS